MIYNQLIMNKFLRAIFACPEDAIRGNFYFKMFLRRFGTLD